MTGRVHSREFKLEVVRQIATGQKRPAQVCREHNLAESLLLRWRREYEERGEAAFGPRGAWSDGALEARIAELERERATGSGERGPEKSVARGGVSERHALMGRVLEEHPGLSVRSLCGLSGCEPFLVL